MARHSVSVSGDIHCPWPTTSLAILRSLEGPGQGGFHGNFPSRPSKGLWMSRCYLAIAIDEHYSCPNQVQNICDTLWLPSLDCHKAASFKERVGLSEHGPLASSSSQMVTIIMSLTLQLSSLASFNSSSAPNRQIASKFTTAGYIVVTARRNLCFLSQDLTFQVWDFSIGNTTLKTSTLMSSKQTFSFLICNENCQVETMLHVNALASDNDHSKARITSY